jgi:predicted nuclease with TOPRIM domain
MRTITTTVYSFNELSEQAQQNAIENLYDINVNYDWWKFTYEDAETVGLKINEFNLDRANFCNIKLTDSAVSICHKIIENHGETCDTYKTAKEYSQKYNELFAKYEDTTENIQQLSDGLSDLDEEFKNQIEQNYLSMLKNEYEYLTNGEEIKETIIANEYEFTEDGTLI